MASDKPIIIDLKDFAGGIKEDNNLSPADFTPRQWAQLRGFVLEDEVSIRSQWPLQSIGNAVTSGMRAVQAFAASRGTYLVGIANDGNIYWMVAPADTATAAATAALTWRPLTRLEGVEENGTLIMKAVPVPPVADYRFLCVQPYTGDTTKNKSALRIHCSTQTAPAVLVYEMPASAELQYDLLTDLYPESFVKYNNVGSWLPNYAYNVDDVVDYNQGYWRVIEAHVSTSDWSANRGKFVAFVGDFNPIAKPGKAPAGECATMWGDTLVIGGNVYWSNGSPDLSKGVKLTKETTKPYSNGIWFSNGGTTDTFKVSNILTGAIGADATVVSLLVIDAGLLVFTTTATGRDGVVLLRGEPGSFTVEVLRGGMGAARRSAALGHRQYETLWSDTGSAVFIDAGGGIWHTDGQQVVRLDRVGPLKPAHATEADHVTAIGPYLLAWRAGRLLVLRMFANTGSWTELVLPAGLAIQAMTAFEASIYFTGTNGSVWRFTTEEVPGERGTANGTALPLTITTATQDGGAEHTSKFWKKIGIRASGLSALSRLVRVTQRADAWFSGDPNVAELVLEANMPLARRSAVLLDGVGPAVEMSASLDFLGDVRMEAIGLVATRGRTEE